MAEQQRVPPAKARLTGLRRAKQQAKARLTGLRRAKQQAKAQIAGLRRAMQQARTPSALPAPHGLICQINIATKGNGRGIAKIILARNLLFLTI